MASEFRPIPYALDACRECGEPLRDDEYPYCRECDDFATLGEEDDDDEMCDDEDDD